jgi:hypothetical protein
MALATKTIKNSLDWAKRQIFNRNAVIGNSLEPALTSANIIQQVILSPPFEWWWNTQELAFTCDTTPNSATSTSSSVSSDVITVTATNTFAAGNILLISGFTGALEDLNGSVIVVLSATSSGFTANINFPNAGPDTSSGVFTNATTQDYTIPVPSFSHIEHASVQDLTGPSSAYVPGKWFELTVKNNLALEASKSRPMFISPHVEDGNGNMTFRVSAAPDKPYPVTIHVQLAAPGITSINQTWAPLPDFMQYIYDWGFLALMYMFADDPRQAYANNQFKAALLGRAEGLTEEEKNIFLNNWEGLQAGYLMKMQQGIAARGQ